MQKNMLSYIWKFNMYFFFHFWFFTKIFMHNYICIWKIITTTQIIIIWIIQYFSLKLISFRFYIWKISKIKSLNPMSKNGDCRNPTLRRVWEWDSHSQNGNLGVNRDSRNFKVRLQGSKHLALWRSLYHWKYIKT